MSYHFIWFHIISYHIIYLQPRSKESWKQPFPGTVTDTIGTCTGHMEGSKAVAWSPSDFQERSDGVGQPTRTNQSHEHGYDIIIRSWMSLWCYSAFMTCYDSDPKHPHQPRLGTKVLKSQVSEVLTGFPTVMLGGKKVCYVYDMVWEVQMCYDRWIYLIKFVCDANSICFMMWHDSPTMSHMRKSLLPWLLLPWFRHLNDTVTPSRLLQRGSKVHRRRARWTKVSQSTRLFKLMMPKSGFEFSSFWEDTYL